MGMEVEAGDSSTGGGWGCDTCDTYTCCSSAAPPVPAIGTAEGDELLAAEAHAAVAAIAGNDLDLGFVDEFHPGLRSGAARRAGPRNTKAPAGRGSWRDREGRVSGLKLRPG